MRRSLRSLDRKIIEDYRNMVPIKEIYSKYNITRSALWVVRSRHRVPPRKKIDRDGIAADRKAGLLHKQIAAKHGLHRETVGRVTRSMGVRKPRSKKERARENNRIVRQLREIALWDRARAFAANPGLIP